MCFSCFPLSTYAQRMAEIDETEQLLVAAGTVPAYVPPAGAAAPVMTMPPTTYGAHSSALQKQTPCLVCGMLDRRARVYILTSCVCVCAPLRPPV